MDSSLLLLEHSLKGIWVVTVTTSLVELVLELNPVKTEGVKETLQGVHAHKHSESE